MKFKLIVKVLGFSITFMVLGSVTLTVWNSFLTKQVEGKLTERYYAFTIANELRQTSMDLTRYARTYATTAEQKYWDEYWQIIKWRTGMTARPDYVNKDLYRGEVKAQSEIMRGIGLSVDEFTILQQISDMSDHLFKLEDQVMQSIKSGEIQDGPGDIREGESSVQFGIRHLYGNFYHQEIYKIRGTVNAFIEKLDQRISGEISLIDRKIRIFTTLVLTLQIFIAAAAAGMACFLIFLLINRRLGADPRELVSLSERISNGNLVIKETGEPAQGAYSAMKKMSSQLTRIIREIKSRTYRLEDVGNGLSESAEESSASLNMMTGNLKSMNQHLTAQGSNVEEVTSAISRINGNIESLNSAIEEQASQVIESSSAIEQMVSSIDSVTLNMNKVHQSSEELNQASKNGMNKMNQNNSQILKIADESKRLMETNQLISGIASQTNLLAMNAAIEAAHAGEAGKGFSVVADEIRKLAESTSQQSHEVSNMLNSIQGLIHEIVKSSEETAASFTVIQDKVENVSQRNEEIRFAMIEQSSGSKQILESLGSMTRITETVRAGANEIGHGSRLVLNEIMQLKDTSDDNRIRIQEITSSVEEINTAVKNVMSTSITNKEMVSGIISELKYFTTTDKSNRKTDTEQVEYRVVEQEEPGDNLKTAFSCIKPVKAQVRGNIVNLTGMLMNLNPEIQQKADALLFKKTGKHWDELTPDDWVETAIWNSFMKIYAENSISGIRALVMLGRKIYPTIQKAGGLPPSVETAGEMLKLECDTFLDYHKGPDVKKRQILLYEPGHLKIKAYSPGYTCSVIEGVYMGILDMYGIRNGRVVQTECVHRGDEACIFDITWPEDLHREESPVRYREFREPAPKQ